MEAPRQAKYGKLLAQIYDNKQDLGRAATVHAAKILQDVINVSGKANVVFSTISWNRIRLTLALSV